MEHTEKQVEISTDVQQENSLILYNDDFLSFDDVILALCEVCGFNQQQSEQIATLAHHKGQAVVKKGEYAILLPVYQGLENKHLTVEII